MAQNNFNASGFQNFAVAANWSLGHVPTSSEDAEISFSAVVDSTSNEDVNSIGLGAGNVLLINSNSIFDVEQGTGTNENSGTIAVFQATLELGQAGYFKNPGSIALEGDNASDAAVLSVFDNNFNSHSLFLYGGGTVVMSIGGGPTANKILGQDGSSYVTLINLDNTISGDGTIGGDLNFLNQGTVETNNGTSTNGGTLVLQGTAGSYNFIAGNFRNSGTVRADNGGKLIFGVDSRTASLENDSVIGLDSTGAKTLLEIAGNVTISAGFNGGVIALTGDASNDEIVSDGNTATLTLVNQTLEGAGFVVDNKLTLNNESGTIDANVNGESMVLNTGLNTINNGGTLEATTNGKLFIESAVNNTGLIAVLGSSGLLIYAAVSGSGAIDVGTDSFMFLDASVAGNVTLTATGALGAQVIIGANGGIGGSIVGAQTNDSIVFDTIAYSPSLHTVWQQTSSSGGTLSLVAGNGSTIETLSFAGQYASVDFQTFSAGNDEAIEIVTPPSPLTYANDFNGLRVGDILWTNGGELGVWVENSSLNPTWELLSSNTNGWSAVGSGDYNGDGISDILWQNGNQVGVWTESSNVTPTWTLLSSNDAGWSVVGGGDYTGSGTDDILWSNGSQLGIWLMNSSLTPTWDLLSSNTGGWQVVGSGDYNGDGISDILFQNGQQLGVWTESSNLTPTWTLLSSNTNGWSVVGSGDYTGDGISDILWSNGSELGVWLMNKSLTPTWELLSSNTGGWKVVGSADYTGSGVSDILWQNGNQLGVWIENSSLNPTWHLLSSNTAGWSVTGAGSPGIR